MCIDSIVFVHVALKSLASEEKRRCLKFFDIMTINSFLSQENYGVRL